MIFNNLQPDQLVRGQDLEHIINAINENELIGDESTVILNKTSVGTTIQVVDQYGGGGGSTVTTDTHPFKITADTDTISIQGGKVSVTDNDGYNKIDYSFPNGDIDISGVTETSTIYTYLKCSITRTNGNDLLSRPTLTVAETNFYQNNQKFPASDLGNYYLPIGIVYLTVDGENRTATASQLQYTNEVIPGPDVHPFKCTSFYNTKTSDTDTDSAVTVFVEKGMVTTQEGSQSLSSITSSISLASCYIKITFTINSDGYAENYNSTLEVVTGLPINTTTTYFFSVSTWSDLTVINSIKENFVSDGRIL